MEEKENFDKDLEFSASLIERAKTGEHTKFEFLTNWDSYCVAREFLHSIEKVEKVFRKLAKADLKQYKRLVKEGKDDVSLLVRQRDMRICQEFYEEEVVIVTNICVEYEWYLTRKLRWLSAWMLGWERPEEDMHDFTIG